MAASSRLGIVIIGMHRSGTSALSRTINLLGFRLPQKIVPAGPGNSLGHWEPIGVMHQNDRILAQLERSWLDPKPLPQGWETDARVLKHHPAALRMLEAEYGSQDHAIVIKEPRVSRLVAFWRDILLAAGIAPHWLITCRNPLEVAASLRERNAFSLEHACRLWQSYMLEAEVATRGMPRAVVHFEALLDDWKRCLHSAFGQLELALPAATDAAAISDFLSHEERHNRATAADVEKHAHIDPQIKALYAHFTTPRPLSRQSTFDAAHQRWLDRWLEISPGIGASELALSQPETFILKSRDLMEQGRLADAIDAARHAVVLAPEAAQSHHILANALARSNLLPEAIAAEECAIALDGEAAEFQIYLGRLCLRAGLEDRALAAATVAVTLSPALPNGYTLLAESLAAANRVDEAIAAQRQAVALADKVVDYRLSLSRYLARGQQLAAAIDCARGALVLAPEDARVHAMLGHVLARSEAISESLECYRRATALDPSREDWLRAMANLEKQAARPIPDQP